MQDGYNHYIRTGENGVIVKGFSTAFEQAQNDDILIAENAGRHFTLNGEINPALHNDQGIPLYKWNGNAVVERTQQEIQADMDALPPDPPTKVEILVTENAGLWYEVMLEKSRNDNHDSDISHLYYEIMMGGLSA